MPDSLAVMSCQSVPQGHHSTPCVIKEIRIIGDMNYIGEMAPGMRLLNTLLEGQEPAVMEFVEELLRRRTGLLTYRLQEASFIDLALWGVTEEQWSLAKRAVAVHRLHERLTDTFPYVTLSQEKGLSARTSPHWFFVEAGERLRPMIIGHWLGREIDVIDEMTFAQMILAIPDGWTLILHGRERITTQMNASSTGRRTTDEK
ncbi:hypothetical protein [Modicisalibacter luteus]|uniref:Uncharacterized protein n=1 Tax=Modicisalibacter luteus TaxID=453962 RepID=A0ABV7LVW3_9GAMM|nr:hypothetical protein [Halomonas lutea]GHB14287.1 hypothetical protein GCM10007159_40840 [Halomonas lutea]